MIKRLFFLFIVIILIQFLPSCLDCPAWPEVRFEYEDIEVKNILFNRSAIIVSEDTLIPKKAYGIKLQVKSKILVEYLPKYLPFFSNSAYAFVDCEPEDTIYKVDKKITDINIYTVNGIGSDFPQGSNVNILFRRFTEYFSYTHVSASNLESFSGNGQFPYPNIDYLLMIPPELSGHYQFKIAVSFSDSSLIEKTTNPVFLF